MTARSLSITIDTRQLKPTDALGRGARAGTAVALTSRMMADLAAELGGHDAACRWLVDLAQEVDRPVLVNVPTGPDTSTTVALAPFWWGRGAPAGLRRRAARAARGAVRPGHAAALGKGTGLMSERPHRQCPSCDVVLAGSEFTRAPRSGTFGAPAHRRCPACGHVALRTAFIQVKRPFASEPTEGQG